MDKRCEECYQHIVEDCPGEKSIDDLDCWQSIEDCHEITEQANKPDPRGYGWLD